MRTGPGRSSALIIEDLNPILRGWINYFRGPWWNAGASHMNQALPAKYFTSKGLVSLLGIHQRLQSLS